MAEPFSGRLLRMLFPHRCFCCGELLPGSGYLCPGCLEALPYTQSGRVAAPPFCDRAVVPLRYQDGVRSGIHRFKYDGRSYYAAFLAGLMAGCLLEIQDRPQFCGVVFVPASREKKLERGFCPAELLARGVAERLDIPVRGGLIGHTWNPTAQMTLRDPEQRRENARRSFAPVRGAGLSGEPILLVDDVLTTGATASRCAELLKGMGAGELWLLAAAVAGLGEAFQEDREDITSRRP